MASTTTTTTTTTTADLVLERWRASARKLQSVAEAIPADRIDWRPASGARTPGEVGRNQIIPWFTNSLSTKECSP